MSGRTFTVVVVDPESGPVEMEMSVDADRATHMASIKRSLAADECEGVPLYVPGYRLTAYVPTHYNKNLERFPFNRLMTQLHGQPILGRAIILDEKPEDSTDYGDGEQDYHKSYTLKDLSVAIDNCPRR